MCAESIQYDSSPIHDFLKEIDLLEWSPPARRASLHTLVSSAIKVGRRQVTYYETVRDKQKYWARAFRFGMVFFGGAGFVLPLLKPFSTYASWLTNGTDAGYVCLALAAICVMGNNVFAASSNQSRFLLTRFKLEKFLTEFRISVTSAELSWASGEITDTDVRNLLKVVKEFVCLVFDVAIEETGAWSSEVQSAIDALSKKFDAASGRKA